ncbi:MAG: DUF6876 family protein [Candidatus Nanoarchaeia archaeon]|jgi:hypothetical protein
MSEQMPDLSGFTGSMELSQWCLLFPHVMTEGIKYLADTVRCYWLLDLVGSYQHKLRGVDFQLWRVEVVGSSAVVTMREDTHEPVRVKQVIGYTDFPAGVFEFYAERNETGNMTLLLKSEH